MDVLLRHIRCVELLRNSPWEDDRELAAEADAGKVDLMLLWQPAGEGSTGYVEAFHEDHVLIMEDRR